MREKKEPLVELKQHRNRFGNDQSAINKHSVRVYYHARRLYILDKTLDMEPPHYSFAEIRTNRAGKVVNGINRTIRVDGEVYWGSEMSWAKAERLIMTVLEAGGISRDTKMILDLPVPAELA